MPKSPLSKIRMYPGGEFISAALAIRFAQMGDIAVPLSFAERAELEKIAEFGRLLRAVVRCARRRCGPTTGNTPKERAEPTAGRHRPAVFVFL